MRDAILAYIKKVKEVADYCKGNEQATKKSLIEPLFAILGYDMADPRECRPEHREDFGRNRSAKPVDYALLKDACPIIFLEAKQVDRRLAGYNEQLGDYFAKAPSAKLGILTNGLHWQFYTDVEHGNVMDKKPFVEWFVLGEEPPPWDFLTLLQKSQYNPELVRTFAQKRHQQNLLLEEISRLLEPAHEFVKLAIANIETRYLTAAVVDGWKPVLRAAIDEWTKQRRLSSVLSGGEPEENGQPEAQKKRTVETTQQELDGLATVQRLLGPDRPVEYEDTPSFFKIHLPGKPFWAVCRLKNFGDRRPSVWVPLTKEQVEAIMPSFGVTPRGRLWSSIGLGDVRELENLGPVLCAAWDQRWSAYGSGSAAEEPTEE
jgi:predicted type IV restriction endonuclease